jgi:TIR domain-containing protein
MLLDACEAWKMTEIQKPVLFVSHAAVDKELALYLKETVEQAFNAIDVFVSSDLEHLPIGDPWVERILAALERANLVLVLATDRGLSRKWVWFEAGAGWDRRRKIFAGCVGKVRKNNLPAPFGQHTARNLDEEDDCREFFTLVRDQFRVTQQMTDHATFCKNLARLDIRAEERQRFAEIKSEEKPFQDAQRRSLEDKLRQFDAVSRDLLRYLLLNGESDGRHVYSAALFPDTQMGNLLQFVEKSGLVLMRIERIGSMEANRFWRINPEFESRLKVLLFPRAEDEAPQKFRM